MGLQLPGCQQLGQLLASSNPCNGTGSTHAVMCLILSAICSHRLYRPVCLCPAARTGPAVPLPPVWMALRTCWQLRNNVLAMLLFAKDGAPDCSEPKGVRALGA